MDNNLSVEQMVRNLLSKAIEDDVVRKADRRIFEQNDPQEMTAGDLCGVANLLQRYLGEWHKRKEGF